MKQLYDVPEEASEQILDETIPVGFPPVFDPVFGIVSFNICSLGSSGASSNFHIYVKLGESIFRKCSTGLLSFDVH